MGIESRERYHPPSRTFIRLYSALAYLVRFDTHSTLTQLSPLHIMSEERCQIHMDGGILDIGTRYAIYGTALLTMGLGCLSMFNVRKSIGRHSTPSTPVARRCSLPPLRSNSMDIGDDEMYKSIKAHKRSVRPVSTTLNLTGVAMVCAAFVHRSGMVKKQAAKEQGDLYNKQGPFTLFHAYTLLSLLWLITLVGMMIHVQTWVFNVIRRKSSVVHRDRRRFINCVWNGTHWYLLQVELLGIFGFYVSTNRDSFPAPPCNMPLFDNSGFRIFARVVYIIAMIPLVNVGLLFLLLVGTVWVMSWIATHLSSNNNSTKRSVSPIIFNFFWLLICLIIILALGVGTEVLLFTHTNSQNVWTFGSLLALTLLLVPAEAFIGEFYYVLAPDEWRHSFKTSTSPQEYHPVLNDSDAFETIRGHKRMSMPEPEIASINTR